MIIQIGDLYLFLGFKEICVLIGVPVFVFIMHLASEKISDWEAKKSTNFKK